MITIATIVFYTTTKKEQALRREKSLYYIYRHYSSHDTWHQLLHTTDNRTTNYKQGHVNIQSLLKKERKKRIKPLNRPKRKAAMNNQKLRPGKLSPNYATVWVAMGQREGTIFPFCSKFFFEFFLFIYWYMWFVVKSYLYFLQDDLR